MSYIIELGGSISQLGNAILGRDSNLSVSSNSYLSNPKAEKVINAIFSPFEKDHCRQSYLLDLRKALQLIEAALPSDIEAAKGMKSESEKGL